MSELPKQDKDPEDRIVNIAMANLFLTCCGLVSIGAIAIAENNGVKVLPETKQALYETITSFLPFSIMGNIAANFIIETPTEDKAKKKMFDKHKRFSNDVITGSLMTYILSKALEFNMINLNW